ncbi:MAG: autotransporter domain-containing protein [Planctomycetota bacterium]|nr:autotransporter domain-containing protein [Planctomycetota bacterium]
MALYGDVAGTRSVGGDIAVTGTEAKGIGIWGDISGGGEKGIHVGNITVTGKGDIADGINIDGNISGNVSGGNITVTNTTDSARGFNAEGKISGDATIALGTVDVRTDAWGAGFRVGKVGMDSTDPDTYLKGTAVDGNANITVGAITVRGLTAGTGPATGYGFRGVGDIIKGNGNSGPKVALGTIDVTASAWGCGVGMYIYDDKNTNPASSEEFYSVDAGTLALNGAIRVAAGSQGVANVNAYGILAKEFKGLDIAHGIAATATGTNTTAYAIYTTGGTSAINVLADVAITATAANGTARDILLLGSGDTLNFNAPTYNRKIVVEGAENVNFTGASTILQAGSSFAGTQNVTVGQNASLTLGDVFTGTMTSVSVARNASLTLQGDVRFSGANFSAASGSTLDFRSVGGNLASLSAGVVTLGQDTTITTAAGINDGSHTFLSGTTALNLSSGYIEGLNALGGTASQNLTYAYNGRSLTLNVANLATASVGNIVDRLAAIGVQRPRDVVTGPFADALFKFTTDAAIVPDSNSSAGFIVQDAMYILAGNTPLNGRVAALTGREGDAVSRALSGVSDAAFVGVANNTAFAAQRLIRDRNDAVRTAMNRARPFASSDALASAILNPGYSNRFWVSGLGLWEYADPRGGDLGYEITSGGFMTGYDQAFGPVVGGVSFGYARGSFKDKAALENNSHIDSYSLNLYATLNHHSGAFVGVMAGYMYSDFDMDRVLFLAGNPRDEGSYHANTWSLGTRIGYDWRPLPDLTLTPSLGLSYHHSRTGRIANTYISIDRLKEDAVQLPVDLEVRYDVFGGLVNLKANAGYAYNIKNDGAEGALTYNGIVNSPRVSVEGRKPGRHTLNLGIGAKAVLGRIEAGVEYDYFAKKGYEAHRVMGTVGISF